MVFAEDSVVAVGHPGEVGLLCIDKPIFQVGVQMLLVGFYAQEVVGFGIDNGLSDFLLAAPHHQHFQQLRNSPCLIGFALHCQLP